MRKYSRLGNHAQPQATDKLSPPAPPTRAMRETKKKKQARASPSRGGADQEKLLDKTAKETRARNPD